MHLLGLLDNSLPHLIFSALQRMQSRSNADCARPSCTSAAAAVGSARQRDELALLVQGEPGVPEGGAVVQALQISDVVLPGAFLQ